MPRMALTPYPSPTLWARGAGNAVLLRSFALFCGNENMFFSPLKPQAIEACEGRNLSRQRSVKRKQ
ncbi:hypothetical protein CJ255_17220 [Candidatus Viridilinea mediisalina]|uniref:Uncharacterized protein n=1 Tax=Candidatus Viridilinea mediisalina TaxID=2024553 RepID=A0A2A6RFK5_9CHLR|nr:hypothetical protein CJ255_17220 [Candidatus Viridilinea mediisalina]